ncbi:MAG: sigma-70 family RNA polymerase sigma factor [Gemmataceae bacterium]|nr:sigma-70 family RNA polymerase sigma factor [Gemmata sp.]MDW8197741.1 sigma-70 family RNA polymerase sigma factor [Gemmataceae bacterium]
MSWTEMTHLVERAKTGDREAFGELVSRYQDTVYGTAFKHLRNPCDAQELTQDVFIHAMNKLAQLRDARCFVSWLRRMTTRMAINRLTRRTPWMGTTSEHLKVVKAKGPTADEACNSREDIEQLKRAMAQMKPLDRQTLEAYYLHGRSLKLMAKEFNVPTGTIKRRLHTARLRLKKELDDLDPLLAERFASPVEEAVAV